MIVAETLKLKEANKTAVIELLKYYTKRGYVAYTSHRKKALAEAGKLGLKVAL